MNISICITTYNGEKYLKEQLDSLVNQTIAPFEVIVQDDCSADNTVEIAKQYMDKLNLKIYVNEINLGFTKNFESVLQKAAGEYIALCDQDDIWENDKLEKLSIAIGTHSLVYSNSLLVNSDGVTLEKTLSQKLKNNFIDSKSGLNFLFDNCVSAHAMMFKSELVKHLFPFPEKVYFDAYIAATAASLDGVLYVDECLVNYRQHTTNTLAKKKKRKTSFMDKIQQKLEKKQKNNDEILGMLQDIKTIKTLNSNEKDLLKELEKYFVGFKSRWFSVKMFLFLYENKTIFFPITKKNSFILCLKKSIGYKLYKAVPFL